MIGTTLKTNRYFKALLAVLAACMAAALLLALVDAKPAQATFPGTNGKIAYTSGGNIFTISPSGVSPTQLTFGGNTRYYATPSYSPDGTKIAYMSEEYGGDNTDNIYTMPATGGSPTQLTNSGSVYCPTFSPSGNTIAYVKYLDAIAQEAGQIYVIPSSGGTPTAVSGASDSQGSCPAYSPDGTKIAYVGGDAQIYTVPSSGGTPTAVNGGDGAHNISYSPDGTKIAFGGWDGNNLQIYTIPSSGGTRTQVTTGGTAGDYDDGRWTDYPSYTESG